MYYINEISHNPSDTKIALLAGGVSGEREISLKSAAGAKEALLQAGYEVEQLDPKSQEDLKKLVDGGYDVAFLCLHGVLGEDGCIQGFLETLGIPYTCSGVWSSATCIDKAKAKVFYEKNDIPTPQSTIVSPQDAGNLAEVVAAIADTLGDKVVVKASTEGSSIGVYIADGPSQVTEALEAELSQGNTVVVERYVKGREFTCVVLGSGDAAQALPVIEIIPKNESYDFESKYAEGGCVHVCPAELAEPEAAAIQRYAVMAQNALECAGAARTDFLMDADGGIWALETNTVPGMTATSLLPDAAAAAGLSFPELCTVMVQMALDRPLMRSKATRVGA